MRPLVCATSLVVLVAGGRCVGAAEPGRLYDREWPAKTNPPVVAGGIVLRRVPGTRSDAPKARDRIDPSRDVQMLLVLSKKNRLRQQEHHRQPRPVRHPETGWWTFPMGRIHGFPAEAPEAAALREVSEETGLRNLMVLVEAGSYSLKRRGERVFFWLRPRRPVALDHNGIWTPRLTPGSEIAQCEWVPWSDALDRLAAPDARVLDSVPPTHSPFWWVADAEGK